MSKCIERPLLAKFAEKTKKTASGRPPGKFCPEVRVLLPLLTKKTLVRGGFRAAKSP